MSVSPVPPSRRPTAVRVIDRLSASLAVLAGLAVVLLAVSVFADVIGRAFFSAPLRGTLEHTAFWWMPMLVLLALAHTERRQEHIKVTILLDALPLRFRQVVEGVLYLLATALILYLAWHALHDALDAAEVGQTTSSTPPIAIWPFRFCAPLGAGALALQTAATSVLFFAGHLPDTAEAA